MAAPDDPSQAPPPRPAAASIDLEIDPVEAALAAGVQAIAAAMMRATPGDLVALADRMAALARELEARRAACSNVVDLSERRVRR